MPVKLRRGKRRIRHEDIEAQLRLWSRAFMFGADYLHELRPLGIRDDAEMLAEAPAAWARLGTTYITEHWPRCAWPERTPWALAQFGEPPCP